MTLALAPVALTVAGIWVLPAGQVAAAGTEAPARATSHQVAQTWLGDCAVCHGADATGTTRGPALNGVGEAAIDYELSTGRMPLPVTAGPNTPIKRHPPRYPPALEHQLVAYVGELSGAGLPIPTVDLHGASLADGGEQFRMTCAACHAWDGDGGALVDRAAPELHAATPTQVAEAVRVGPGAMPAFGTAALTPAQLDDVVAYVRYLDHPNDRGGNPLWHLGPMAEGGAAWFIGILLLYLAVRWIGEKEPAP